MKLIRLLAVLILLGGFLQNTYGASENWVFLGISSVDFSTDYYDANSIKINSGLFSGPTARVTVRAVYPDNHPELKSEKAFMQFYCKKKTFLTIGNL